MIFPPMKFKVDMLKQTQVIPLKPILQNQQRANNSKNLASRVIVLAPCTTPHQDLHVCEI